MQTRWKREHKAKPGRLNSSLNSESDHAATFRRLPALAWLRLAALAVKVEAGGIVQDPAGFLWCYANSERDDAPCIFSIHGRSIFSVRMLYPGMPTSNFHGTWTKTIGIHEWLPQSSRCLTFAGYCA